MPLINEQPASQNRQPGETSTFIVTARGPVGSTLTYQWYRDGVPLVNGPRVFGAQTPALNITSLALSDAGAYTVAVTDDCGFTRSLPAILSFDSNMRVQILSSGSTVSLTWTSPSAQLQQADSANGPWSVVPGATSPFISAASGSTKFFRLRESAP